MTQTPLAASVVVPSRGGVRRLPILLGALHRQDRDDFEVILVLDGDIDRSRQAAERFSASFGDRLRIVEFPENRGRVAALNAGFEKAQGHVLIRCDDDFEPAPGYVDAHVTAHAQSTAVGVVGLPHNRFADTLYARAYGRARDGQFREEAYARPETDHWRYWASNCSLTRVTYQRVGPYDPDYRAYGWEDVDYGYRLHALGIPVRLVREAETVHHAAAVTTALRMTRAFHAGAARRLFDAKHPEAAHGPAADGRAAASDSPSLWSRLVAAEANLLTAASVERVGAAIDRALPFLPHYVAEKLVASGVEAASLAGQRTDGQLERTF